MPHGPPKGPSGTGESTSCACPPLAPFVRQPSPVCACASGPTAVGGTHQYQPLGWSWSMTRRDSPTSAPGLVLLLACTARVLYVGACTRHRATHYPATTLLAYHPIPALPYSEYPRTAPSFGACACAGPRAAADHALDAALGRGVRRCCAPCSRARSRCRHASWLVCRWHRKGKIYCNWPVLCSSSANYAAWDLACR